MRCEKCEATVYTVGELRRCGGCQDDTAQQIPADMADEAPIEDAIAVKDGLGNRFKLGGDPRPEPAPAPQMADEVAAVTVEEAMSHLYVAEAAAAIIASADFTANELPIAPPAETPDPTA